MRAEDLNLEELVDFRDGSLNLHGRRLVLHALHGFAQFRKDLVEMVGVERARRILTRYGYIWGQADAAALKRIFEWDSLFEWLKAAGRMQSLEGVGRTVVHDIGIDEATGAFHMEITWRNSGEAEEHLFEFGRSQRPVCWIQVGYAGGYASFCLGRDVYFIERQCAAAGDPLCWAVGKDRESWGAEIEPHLPYYEAEDIQGKILGLTEELKRKTRELAEERQRRALIEGAASPTLVEVRSESFRRVVELASRAAPYDTSILVLGESGVGKEVMARYIHQMSRRTDGPFLALNCGALPETLLESELFGHKAGAFTGAVEDRVGLFEAAEAGTIFLDEIGEVSAAMQVKLLRVLQEREIMRVGESQTRKVDVRVIAATNRDLKAAIRDGVFREDLYYRLGVIEVEIPPLRQRRDDILPLARHFVTRLSKRLSVPELRLHATCLNYLNSYPWPGNVRELENAVERAAVMCGGDTILPEHLPPQVLRGAGAEASGGDPTLRSMSEVETDHIRAVLRHTGGNRTQTAQILGISPATLWRKLKKLEGADAAPG